MREIITDIFKYVAPACFVIAAHALGFPGWGGVLSFFFLAVYAVDSLVSRETILLQKAVIKNRQEEATVLRKTISEYAKELHK